MVNIRSVKKKGGKIPQDKSAADEVICWFADIVS